MAYALPTPVRASVARVEIEEALAHATATAKATHPSPRYDRLHEYINELLTAWEGAS